MPRPPALKDLLARSSSTKESYKESKKDVKKYESSSDSESEDERESKNSSSKRFTSEKSSVSDDQLDELLREWSKIKKTIVEYEEKEAKCKKLIAKLMDEEDSDSLFSDSYIVKRRIQKRKTITQKDLPSEVWDKYARQIQFPVFTLKKI